MSEDKVWSSKDEKYEKAQGTTFFDRSIEGSALIDPGAGGVISEPRGLPIMDLSIN